ncbi:MAG TPA: hypothetical protein VGC41_06935 [Kofleriaceae bacterium]
MKAIVLLILVGCASETAVSPLRFKNQPNAMLVDDRHEMKKPTTRVFARTLYMLDNFFATRAPRMMERHREEYAGDVNALDEVPDSTWFTNRIGIRDLTPEEIEAAGREAFAAPKGPWVITGTKVGGASPGFVVKDAAGAKFIMKFDSNGQPDMQTGADVVVQKILWAAGFYTPEDAIVTVTRKDLTLGPTAKVEDTFGNKHKMIARDIDEVLAKVDHEPDGSYRTLVSRYLIGEPVGGYSQVGIREDDPNDKVAHEDRRTLRAQRVFFAWLGSTDVKEDNGLDMYVVDKAGQHYLLHYLVDFGLALGVYGYDQTDPSDGYALTINPTGFLISLVTLGLWEKPWEGADGAPLRGVGRFESRHYQPLTWRDRYPYYPFDRIQPADAFWAAKIILRFTEAQLRAAVETGHYNDPRAVDYLTKTLLERGRKTAYEWFGTLSPLDNFKITNDGTLCFDDLMRVNFRDTPPTTYVAHVYNYAGRALGETKIESLGPHACMIVPVGGEHDEYTIVEISANRGGDALTPVRVHLARQSDELRVIGIRRSRP